MISFGRVRYEPPYVPRSSVQRTSPPEDVHVPQTLVYVDQGDEKCGVGGLCDWARGADGPQSKVPEDHEDLRCLRGSKGGPGSMKVSDLKPGMVIVLAGIEGTEATVLAVHHPHPKHLSFELVLWQVRASGMKPYFSHDCLKAEQYVGELGEPYSLTRAWARLLEAL